MIIHKLDPLTLMRICKNKARGRLLLKHRIFTPNDSVISRLGLPTCISMLRSELHNQCFEERGIGPHLWLKRMDHTIQ